MAREPHVQPADEPRVIVVLHRKGSCPWLQRIARQTDWPTCDHEARRTLLRRIFAGARVIVVQVGPAADDPVALGLLRLLHEHWTPVRVVAVDLSPGGVLEPAIRRAGVTLCFTSISRPDALCELVNQLLGCDLSSDCHRPTDPRVGSTSSQTRPPIPPVRQRR